MKRKIYTVIREVDYEYSGEHATNVDGHYATLEEAKAAIKEAYKVECELDDPDNEILDMEESGFYNDDESVTIVIRIKDSMEYPHGKYNYEGKWEGETCTVDYSIKKPV